MKFEQAPLDREIWELEAQGLTLSLPQMQKLEWMKQRKALGDNEPQSYTQLASLTSICPECACPFYDR